MTAKKSSLIPRWILRVVGYSSLAVAVVGLALYWYKKYPSRRRIRGDRSTENNEVQKRKQLTDDIGYFIYLFIYVISQHAFILFLD